jgi:hypothetical protein
MIENDSCVLSGVCSDDNTDVDAWSDHFVQSYQEGKQKRLDVPHPDRPTLLNNWEILLF